MQKQNKKQDTSWEKSSDWYAEIVGSSGHYYHEHIILPGVLRLMNLKSGDSVLDVGCGQGILAGKLPKEIVYEGIDASASLIRVAQAHTFNKNQHFSVADVTKTIPLVKKDFTHAIAILSLQNMEALDKAIKHVSEHLSAGGKFIMVLNHPYFRIPKHSGWGTEPTTKEQYRWVKKYMSALKIVLQMHPGKDKSETTLSFHHSLAGYTNFLHKSGLVIEKIEEWVTDKKSTNKLENESFKEIPLFMAIVAVKK